ncbi:hypothetical protein AX764_04360 [Oenococcus oeni]|nr:hypothetical protein AX764_04360 [Oenococcus oeni]
MFQLTNAKGETVDIQTNAIRAYTPVGLGSQFTNTYVAYGAHFIRTNHQPVDPTTLPGQFYIGFGGVMSQSYQSFADFASFLAYEPLTLTYTTDSGTWMRKCYSESLTKTEIGGSSVNATDVLNEIFIVEFASPWYQEKSVDYADYPDDDGLAIFGKGYVNQVGNVYAYLYGQFS